MNDPAAVLVEVGVERRAGPGARLRAARLERGLEIGSIAAALRVSTRLVTALEEDDYAAFDAPVYARGFLRTYASFLGLPLAEVLNAYEELAGGQPAPSLIPPASLQALPRDYSALKFVAGFAAAIVLVGASYWWWLARSPAPPLPLTATAQPAATADAQPSAFIDGEGDASLPDPLALHGAPDPMASLPPAPASTSPRAALPPAAGASAAVARPNAPAPKPAAATTAPPSSTAGAAPARPTATTTTAKSTPIPTNTPAIAPHAPAADTTTGDGPELVMHASKDCWVELLAANGSRLFYDLVRAGQTRTVRGAAPWRVFLGNVDGIELSVDGQAIVVPPAHRQAGKARFGLNADGSVHY